MEMPLGMAASLAAIVAMVRVGSLSQKLNQGGGYLLDGQPYWKSGKQNGSASGQCGGVGTKTEPRWIASREMEIIVVVGKQEGG